MSLFFSFFPIRVRVLVPDEGRTRPLTPVGVRVPVPGEVRTRPLTPVGVGVPVPGEGRMIAHARSCSSSR